MSTVNWSPKTYPPAKRSDHVDVYKSEARGEVSVPDPYKWLEDAYSKETDAWVTEQEQYTRAYLDQIADRERLEKDIRANTDYAKFTAPSYKNDGRWYWYYNSGLQAQWTLYRSKDSKLPTKYNEGGSDSEVFFDMNLLSDDGTAAITTSAFSKCGKYYAYGVSRSGSDFFTIYVRKTDQPLAVTGNHRPSHDDARLSDELRFAKFTGIAWTHDSKGFFYQRLPGRASHGEAQSDKAGTETEGDYNAMLYYHKIGTPQSEDILVLKDEEHPTWQWGAGISEVDGRFLEVGVVRDTSKKNLMWIADLQDAPIGPNMKWIRVADEFNASYDIVANNGTRFYFMTNKDAPKRKLVTVDLADPKLVFEDHIPEEKDALLKDVLAVSDDKLIVTYERNVQDEVYVHSLSSGKRLRRLAETHVGSIGASGKREHQSQVFLILTGYTSPGTILKYDLASPDEERKLEPYRQTVLKGLNPDEFLAEQVWYRSKDGTKIPMFVVRHKSTKFDGTASAIQYGYGGFDISITPSFSPSILTYIKAFGAIFASANIRGSGEFGEEWHLAGTRERKHNCFDDFIAAAEFLTKEKYVAPGKVAINGGSNGGLLVAASINRAPEGTFGAAVAEVGVLDLLKFNKFTIGRAWTSDYGNPDEPHDFDFIYPISPVHNVPTDRVLPPTILMTADHDDRVVPLHSFKHAATLQHTLASNPNPLLLRVSKKAGHGAGKSTEQRVKEQADKWSFVAHTLGLKRVDL